MLCAEGPLLCGAALLLQFLPPVYFKETETMVAINTTDSVQRVFFPLPVQTPAPAADIAVRLVNTVDGNEVTLAVSDWAAEGFLLRAVVQLPAADFYPGEWKYTLTYVATDGDRYYGLGLVNAREKDPGKAVQYEHEVIYKQYGE